MFLHPGTLPAHDLTLDISGHRHRWRIRAEERKYTPADCRMHCGWVAWKHTPPTSRHAVFYDVWSRLRQLSAEERTRQVQAVREWAAIGEPPAQNRCMTAGELLEISRDGIVSVGAHTITHSRLSALPAADQMAEISGSRAALEEIVGSQVDTFSYPFGGRSDYGADTVQAVRAAGFSLACSNFEGVVDAATDRYQLPRLHAEDMDGDKFTEWLRPYLRE